MGFIIDDLKKVLKFAFCKITWKSSSICKEN